ncbi:EAL domain-containing protein [Nocardioides sp. CER19]|uniref:putative bifunctional diguanylate cyclase/phosphodiesterase n=1 Tax=Nocardioides sp. CER19 TaxID=3038538 RepID=UPI00244C3B2B|nr:EAL domain-containing protein [Nocardioides sp. CER19]MDH2415397.1 EAL domain-containing protein [Nocardioides sp. CER19]
MTEAVLTRYDTVALRGRLLRELSIPVPVLLPDTPLREVELRFRDDPALRAVAVRTPDGPALLTRVRLEALLSGRLGYGRALLARAPLGAVVEYDGFHLDGVQPLREAAAAILAHGSREDDVLVLSPDGAAAAAPVATIFREVGMMFREIALRDPLTGLANRRMLDEHGGGLLSAGVDPDRLAVLYVDLDGFKQVNDALGHKAGDALLLAFAQRLVRTVRPVDLVGRLGGDEFAVLLSDVDETEATDVADRIVATARRPFTVHDQQVYVSASVGIATGRDVAGAVPVGAAVSALDALLHHADGAMLHAKRAGKARTSRLHVREEAGAFERRALIRGRLHEALAHGGLALHYQPKLSLHSGRVESVEALLRWTDELLGRVSPVEVIAVAEHTGQISELGEWVLRNACAQARLWHDEGRDWAVAINVSPVQLAAPGLAKSVLAAVEEAGIPPRLLQVEVTESTAVSDMSLAGQQLAELQAGGVLVHLDDFGTGYSSLAMLRRLPVSTLKIDQSIVGRIDSDEADAQLLSGVINAAHTLGLTVVAEGVERPAQIHRLRELGCDVAQGYLISRPQPAPDLIAMIDGLPRPTEVPALES